MADEYKNASDEFKNVPEHETPKIATTEEPSEVKDRGMFDFLKKKEEVKPQETKTPLEPEFEHKTQISEEEHKPHTLLEQLHQTHEEEEANKPGLLHKLHRSNSSSSSSSEEEGEDGVRRKKKKEKKKIVEGGEVKTEEAEKKGLMEKIKEKLPGHGTKTEEGSPAVVTHAAVPVNPSPVVEEAPEKKGFLEKIKEKLPGHHAKSSGEEKVAHHE